MASSLERARAGPPAMRELCHSLEDADASRKPGVGKLSIVEHVCHLIDMERDVFGVRLRRVIEEDDAVLDPLNMDHFVDEERSSGQLLPGLLDEWEQQRADNVTFVESTGPEQWVRESTQPGKGKVTFTQMVETWSRHDAEHLRQVEIIALNCRERNLG